MEGQKNNMRVGIFVALGLVAVLGSILALGGEKALFRRYLRLNAKLDQVQGLSVGSVVSLAGVTVGNIEKIDFGENGNLIVTMKIDKKFNDRIPKDSTVEVRTSGALGDKFIYISPGTPASGLVVEGDSLDPVKSQDLIGMLTEKGGQASKIFEMIGELQTLLHSINEGNRTSTILKNAADTSSEMKQTVAELHQLIGEMRSQNAGTLASSMKRLDSILTKIDRGEGSLGALINDPSIHEQLKALLGGSPRKKYFESILNNSIEK